MKYICFVYPLYYFKWYVTCQMISHICLPSYVYQCNIIILCSLKLFHSALYELASDILVYQLQAYGGDYQIPHSYSSLILLFLSELNQLTDRLLTQFTKKMYQFTILRITYAALVYHFFFTKFFSTFYYCYQYSYKFVYNCIH